MKTLYNLFSSEFIEATGWTIVHSLWQATIVAVVLTFLLLLIRRNSSQLKYIISFFAMLIIVGWSGITFANAYNYAKEKTVLRDKISSDPSYIKLYLADKLQIEQNSETAATEVDINFRLLKIRSFFQRNFNLICLFWIIGMIFLIIRMIGGFIYAHRLRTSQLIDIGDDWLKKIEEFAFQLKISRKVQAFFSPLAKVPITLGTIKPVILFPLTAFTGLSVKDVEAILAHELAHILRHDYLFNIIQRIVEILFFYHPAVWIISSQIQSERENSCDDIAIELTGDRLAYVKALAAVQINQMEQGQIAMAFASSKGNLLHRIQRLQKKVAMKTNFIEGLIAAGVIVIGLFLVSFTMENRMSPQEMPSEIVSMVLPIDESGAPLAKPAWTKQKRDSVQHELEKNIQQSEALDNVSDEMKKMVEVAMSECDAEVSAEMMEEINKAVKDFNIEAIVHEALREAQKAIREAHAEIDYNEIRRDLKDAQKEIEEARREMRDEMWRDMNADNVPSVIIELSVSAAEIGLNVASAVLGNLPIDDIIHTVLSGVEAAVKGFDKIDFDKLNQSDTLTEEDINRLKEQLEQEEERLKIQKEKLKEKEKELKKRK